MNLTVVIITHNSSSLLCEHLETLRHALSEVGQSQVIVVDSGSSDDTIEQAQKLLPDGLVVDLGANRGYAAGINVGIAAGASSGPVLILNPDTRPQQGSIAALLAALDGPGVGISVPRLVDEQGATQFSLRRRPTVLRAFGEAVLGGRRAGQHPWLGEVIRDLAYYEWPHRTDWATGAVMCVSRRCLEAVGPWDESFFLYSEETDFALRATEAGLNTQYVPDAIVMHHGGESNVSPRLFSVLTVNRLRLFRRRANAAGAAAFWCALVLQNGLRAAAGSGPHRAGLLALFRPRDRVIAEARGISVPSPIVVPKRPLS